MLEGKGDDFETSDGELLAISLERWNGAVDLGCFTMEHESNGIFLAS